MLFGVYLKVSWVYKAGIDRDWERFDRNIRLRRMSGADFDVPAARGEKSTGVPRHFGGELERRDDLGLILVYWVKVVNF